MFGHASNRQTAKGTRFNTFAFVDQITDIEPGVRARGRFAIPEGLPSFSPWLAVEAIGQLAAWAAMAGHGFLRKPVAGLGGEIRLIEDARPGTILHLGADLESCDEEAVSYNGWARAGETSLVEIQQCVGPLLPTEQFDSPDLLRDDFAVLCGAGAPAGRFPGVAELRAVTIDRAPGKRARARLHVPASAPYFADHFPRKPVFPATLLMDACARFAEELAEDAGGRGRRVLNAKLRSFIPPGSELDLEAEVVSKAAGVTTIAVAAHLGAKRIASAHVEIERRRPS